MFTPNDTRYAEQWDLFETTGGIRLPAAIDTATNDGAGAVVAVIDTGITVHPDLAGQTVAGLRLHHVGHHRQRRRRARRRRRATPATGTPPASAAS